MNLIRTSNTVASFSTQGVDILNPMPAFGTVSLQNKAIPSAGHRGIGFIMPTVVGLKSPTRPVG